MIKRIHVNQHHIRRNTKLPPEERLPVITIKTSRHNIYAEDVIFEKGQLVYHPDKPLSCGAKVWIVTRAPVHYLTKNEKGELVAKTLK